MLFSIAELITLCADCFQSADKEALMKAGIPENVAENIVNYFSGTEQ